VELRIIKGHFKDKREAITEICAADWWPLSWRDAAGEVYEPHKHAADQTLYLVQGTLEMEIGGQVFRMQSGDKIELPAFTVHAVKAPAGATYIVGMPTVDLAQEHSLAPDA
jgi:quercetin dioxygenase-like cupin family protein